MISGRRGPPAGPVLLSRPRLVIPQWQSDGYGTGLREYGIRNTQQGTLQNRTALWVFPRLPGAIVQSTERPGTPPHKPLGPLTGSRTALFRPLPCVRGCPRQQNAHCFRCFAISSLRALSRFTKDVPTAARQTEPYEHDPGEDDALGDPIKHPRARRETRGAEQTQQREAGVLLCVYRIQKTESLPRIPAVSRAW